MWDIQQDTERYQKDKELYHKYAYLSGKEECFAIFRVKRKYKEVKKQILSIKSDFTQKDLERLFYITFHLYSRYNDGKYHNACNLFFGQRR